MEEYKRAAPLFSLCGLNCGLCPRYQTQGESKCPGCGGPDFHLKHPSCAVITCSKKHGSMEYCFQCASYPCERYSRKGEKDSFMSYRNVITDFAKAKTDGVEPYMTDLRAKIKILEFLINTYNDGRRKAFYCNAVNLLPLPDLREIMIEIQEKIASREITPKEKIEEIVRLFEAHAKASNIELKLRK